MADQPDERLIKFGHFAQLKFKRLTDNLYESAIREAKNLVDQYSLEGIASAGNSYERLRRLSLIDFKRQNPRMAKHRWD